MEFRHLRYFVAVAEELSFTRAAAVLHVAQSAVSAQIHLLEDSVGVVLLERNSRRVELTGAGHIFLRGAKKIITDLEEIAKQARRIGRAETGHLAIGFIGAQSHEWMPLVLRRFRREYPDVEVTLTEMVPSVQLEALSTHRLDLGVVGAIDGKAPAGLQVECIAEEQPLVGVPKRSSAGEPSLYPAPTIKGRRLHSDLARKCAQLPLLAGATVSAGRIYA